MNEYLFTTRLAALRLGVQQQTVQRWVRSGKLRGLRLGGGRRIRIAESDLKKFLGIEDPPPQAHTAPLETKLSGVKEVNAAYRLLKDSLDPNLWR